MHLNGGLLLTIYGIVCASTAASPQGKSVWPPTASVPPLLVAGTESSAGNAPIAEGGANTATTVPGQYKLNLLIRSTIIAVDQANKTGNYSVLRDLGSPNFRNANSDAKLSEIFSSQRNANLDLAPVLFFTPKLIQAPFIDADGMLRLTGFFATQPQQVYFDLAFEFIQGEWRLFGVNVGTRPAPAEGAPATK